MLDNHYEKQAEAIKKHRPESPLLMLEETSPINYLIHWMDIFEEGLISDELCEMMLIDEYEGLARRRF